MPTPSTPSEVPETPEQAPVIEPEPRPAPPAPPTPPKRARRRTADASGVQVVLGLGAGNYQDTLTTDGTDTEAKTEGLGIAGIAAVGWTVTPGLVLGVGGVVTSMSEPTVTIGDVEATPDILLRFATGGAYVDFGDASGDGWHVLGVAGFATLESDEGTDAATGVGGAAGLGYRVRIDDDLRVGIIGLVAVGTTTVTPEGTTTKSTIESVTPNALLTVSWH